MSPRTIAAAVLAIVVGAVPLIAMMAWGYRELGSLGVERIESHELIAEASRLFGDGQLERAAATCRQAIALDEVSADALSLLGLILGSQDDPTAAMRFLQRALEIDPKHSLAHHRMGLLFQSLGQTAQAIQHYRNALKTDRKNHQTLNNLAMLVQGDEAISLYQRAIKVKPDYYEAHYNLANALARKGLTEEALVHYRRAASIRPESADAQRGVGVALHQSGRTVEALPYWRQAVKLNTERADTYLALAWTLATHPDESVRRPDEAITHAEHGVERSGETDPRALDVLATAYASAGKFDQAIATAEQAQRAARASGLVQVAAQVQRRLDLYRQHQPYREPVALRAGQ